MSAAWRAIASGERRGPVAALARLLLAALALLYALAVAIRNALYDAGILRARRAPCPVVSIGNIVAGGTGKTPLVEHVARLLLARGRRPAIVARGYGAARAGAENDEARVLAENLPEVPRVLDADRVRGAARAVAEHGADVVILDDGFQHRRIARDLDVVLIDALDPWGLGRLLPRGLLREPVCALRRADLVLVTRADLAPAGQVEEIRARVRAIRPDLPVGEVVDEPIEEDAARVRGRGVVAFCGIGNPDGFFRRLEAIGARVAERVTFPDHHPYAEADRARLAAAAARGDALVTTQKDAVKLAGFRPPVPLVVLRIRAAVRSGADDLTRLLDNALRHCA